MDDLAEISILPVLATQQSLKMKYGMIFAFMLLSSMNVFSQTIQLREVCRVPSNIPETSGIEITEGTFWSFNDSGGEPAIYHFDSTGTYYRSLRFQNAQNVDWEDVTQDSDGNFYIGDFGNNDNKRTDLRIYKFGNPLPVSTSITNAKIIEFSYSDQVEFPPSPFKRHFDMEAMIWYEGSLYLFSKNRTDPFDGIVHLYKLPDTPGSHTAVLVDSFYTGPGTMFENWVTAADISPDGTKLILLGQGKAWLFTGFNGDNFFGGHMQVLRFPFITQKEAVCFASNTELYITDELVLNTIGGKLYYANLSTVLPNEVPPAPEGYNIHAYPNPFTKECTISFAESRSNRFTDFDIYNELGEKVYTTSVVNRHNIVLNESLVHLSPGTYYAVLREKNEAVETLRLVKLQR